jgi:hypothetical protein
MKNTMDKNASTEMNTLAECMNQLYANGYTQNFSVGDNGLQAADSEKKYQPEEVRIVNFYRFEGYSDPGDSSLLFAIETNDGLKGLLTDAYGVYAEGKTSAFVAKVEDIQKDSKRRDDMPHGDQVQRTSL